MWVLCKGVCLGPFGYTILMSSLGLTLQVCLRKGSEMLNQGLSFYRSLESSK